MRFHSSRSFVLIFSLLLVLGCGQKRAALNGGGGGDPVAENTAPFALSATFSVEKNSSLTEQLSGSDADGDPLTFSLSAPAQHGTVSVTTSGSFTYTPQSSYTGVDSFAFKVSDGLEESLASLVSLNVVAEEVNPAPSGSFTAIPETGSVFVSGGKARLTWAIVNATSCKLNNIAVAISGTTLTAPLTAQTNFNLECTGTGGSRTFVQTVTPGAAPVTLSVPGAFAAVANPGNTVTLTWEYDSSSATFFSFVRQNPSGPDTIWTVPIADRSFTDRDLTTGSSYIYKMRAGSPTAESAYTASITVTAIAASGPVNVDSVNLARTSPVVLTASWPSAGSGATYKVAKAVASSTPVSCASGTATSNTSFAVTGLNPFTEYDVRVCTVGANNAVSSGTQARAKTPDNSPVNVSNFVQVSPSQNELTFNWAFSGSALNVAGGFLIKMSESSTGSATAPGDCSDGVALPLSARSYQVANLASNKSYAVRICTKNGDNAVSAGVALNGLYTIPPAPPSPVFGATTRNPTTLEFNWISGGGSTASYLLKYQQGATAPANCDNGIAVNGTIALITGLTQNTTYSAILCAVNANGLRSPGVTRTEITPVPAAPNPTGFTVAAKTATSLTISWTSGGGSTQRFLFKGVAGATAPADCIGGTVVSGSSFQWTGLASDTEYSARICAQNVAGDLSSGLVGQGRTNPALPPNPTSWQTTQREVNSLSVSWVSGGGSTVGYRFRYVQGSTPPATCDGGVELSSPNYVLTSLAANTQYAARVCAVNSIGQVSSGLAGSDTTLSSIPPNPSWGTTVKSYTSLELNWASGGGTTANYLVRWVQGSIAPLNCTGGTVVNATKFVITGLRPDTVYSARLCAQNAGGEKSSGITASERTLVSMPPNPTWGATDRALTSLRVRWNSGGGSTNGFIFRYAEGIFAPSSCVGGSAVAGTEILLENLKGNTVYSARVCAVGETGEISSGITGSNRTLSNVPPDSAGFLSTSSTSTTYRLSWNPAGGSTVAYLVALRKGILYPDCNGSTERVTEPTILLSGLEPGQHYAVRICSVNAGGERSPGLTGRDKTLDPPPNPRFATNVKTSNSITWNFTSGGGTTAAVMIKVVRGANNPNDCSGGTRVNLSGNSGSFVSTGLSNNTRYSARICAIDNDGAQSRGVARTEKTN